MSSPNIENVKIGEVEIWIDEGNDGSEVMLGHTLGGVELTIEREFQELNVDKYSSPVDYALTGNKLMAKCFLAEPVKKYLKNAIPEGNYVINGSDDKLGIGRDTGYLLSESAAALRLHPRKNAADNLDDDVYIFRAVSYESVEQAYKVDEQRVLEITFVALPDESQFDGQRLGRIGNAEIS